MRKKVYILIFICLIIGVLFVIFLLLHNKSNDKFELFSLDDYKDDIENFLSDRVVGTTENVQQAKEKAESVWIEIYGKDEKKWHKPYEVFYDEYEEVWLVMGSLPSNTDGGVPYILIKKSDGKVLAVWHDK
ncbi:MAG: YbbC/YhhH family protein [Clostridiales bacterium]|jgi:hypothetical protein|nr:YbbC/YhhH family protein [Clostridiales bacterium]